MYYWKRYTIYDTVVFVSFSIGFIVAELKTKPNNRSVSAFINSVDDELKRKDCKDLLKMFKSITRKKPKLWGDSIIGFGSYHYKYPTGNEGDWFITGFSPRKQNFTIHIMNGFANYNDLLKKLGKHKIGKSCLYVKKLEYIDRDVLQQMIVNSFRYMTEKYECK